MEPGHRFTEDLQPLAQAACQRAAEPYCEGLPHQKGKSIVDSAFPSGEFQAQTGLTKLEYITTHVLVGLLARQEGEFSTGTLVEQALIIAKQVLARAQQL
jgi:hypothetical protein